MRWLFSKIIKPEYIKWKKNWRFALTFLIVIFGVSAMTGIKSDDILLLVILSVLTVGIIIIALNIIFREKK